MPYHGRPIRRWGKAVPDLRARGFKGSGFHLRRFHPAGVDVPGFQFSSFGAYVYVEIAASGLEGETLLDGTHFPANTIKSYQCSKRERIGTPPTFSFENDERELTAHAVLLALSDAHSWWTANRG